jgi:hypothetical protein
MKIRCAHCRELFVPSRGQRRDLMRHEHQHYCSRACKAAAQAEARRAKPLPAESLLPVRADRGFHLHLQVADAAALDRLLAALDDDVVVVKVRPVTGHQYALTMLPGPPPPPGSIMAAIRQASARFGVSESTPATVSVAPSHD